MDPSPVRAMQSALLSPPQYNSDPTPMSRALAPGLFCIVPSGNFSEGPGFRRPEAPKRHSKDVPERTKSATRSDKSIISAESVGACGTKSAEGAAQHSKGAKEKR